MATSKPAPKILIQKMIDENLTTTIDRSTSLPDFIDITDKRVKYLWDKVSNPTNNPRMLLNVEKEAFLKNRQVYLHKETDGTVVYVGKGDHGRSQDGMSRRQADHSLWILLQQIKGLNFCEIIKQNLYSDEAAELERELIELHKPKFNRR